MINFQDSLAKKHMIPPKISIALEHSTLANITQKISQEKNWSSFNRTVFNQIAKSININVTQKVLLQHELITNHLIIGKDELSSIISKNKYEDIKEFIEYLSHNQSLSPFNWISGKTLHSYWNGGNAKDKKLNVLLTFLNIDPQYWDEWKTMIPENQASHLNTVNTESRILEKFIGFYFRYYQKADHNKVMIKAPLWITKGTKNEVKAYTKTIGHQYHSKSIDIKEGALYINCENIHWNEQEYHIYNIGFSPNPEVILGVSNTLNRKGRAIGIKNLLIKQEKPYVYDQVEALEIPFDTPLHEHSIDHKVLHYFSRENGNLISTKIVDVVDDLL